MMIPVKKINNYFNSLTRDYIHDLNYNNVQITALQFPLLFVNIYVYK